MRRRATLPILIAALALSVPTPHADAQVSVGAGIARERVLWHFDTPSSYDTVDLVPHFFEQDYVLDNVALTLAAQYRLGIDWHSVVELTPIRQARATDYDTFFDPGGITWVAGTSGDARVHGVRLSQAVELGRFGQTTIAGGYRVGLAFADFLDGDRTDVRNGIIVARSIVTTREYTRGELHEIFVSAAREWPLSSAWTLRVSGDLTPAAINRLAIQLPDKYPGRTLTFQTTNAMTTGRVEVRRGTGRWPLTVRASGVRSWNYSGRQWVRRRSLTLGVTMGRVW
ncbi:MAG: hypothetical protein QM736_03415 [Vicinamibacterales bacterium]